MVDDQLALVAEQVGQRFLAVRAVEGIGLVDFHPRQFAALAAERIAGAGKRFFLGKVGLAGNEPFVAGNDLVRLHGLLLEHLARTERAMRG